MATLQELRDRLQERRDQLSRCEGKIDQIEQQLRDQGIDPNGLTELIDTLTKERDENERELDQLIDQIEKLLG